MKGWLGAVGVFSCLACAGPSVGGGGGPVVRRVDISHVDGISCMAKMPNGMFVPLDQPYDPQSCGERTREGFRTERARAGGFRDVCESAWGAVCCTQGGGEIVGWEAHTVGRETVASPLCLYR